MTTKGPDPNQYYRDQLEFLVGAINRVGANLNREIVRATPVGIGGELQRSWSFNAATRDNPIATVGSSSQYLLPVELGRKPGKGISAEGQTSVQLWARRKLQLSPAEAKGFAYLLSEKYKREGRPAQGFMGLAKPGQPGGQDPEIVQGGIVDRHFRLMDAELNKGA